jgi:hypothetical protein
LERLPVTKIEKWRNYEDKKIERLVIYLITEYKELKIKIEAISLFACESKGPLFSNLIIVLSIRFLERF